MHPSHNIFRSGENNRGDERTPHLLIEFPCLDHFLESRPAVLFEFVAATARQHYIPLDTEPSAPGKQMVPSEARATLLFAMPGVGHVPVAVETAAFLIAVEHGRGNVPEAFSTNLDVCGSHLSVM